MALYATPAASSPKHLVSVPIGFWIVRFSWTLLERLGSLSSVISVEAKNRPTLIRRIAFCPESG
jgi:hypothetical protein